MVLGSEINPTTPGGYIKNLKGGAKVTDIPISIGEFWLFHCLIINNSVRWSLCSFPLIRNRRKGFPMQCTGDLVDLTKIWN